MKSVRHFSVPVLKGQVLCDLSYEASRVIRFTETEGGMVGAKGWEEGHSELLFNRAQSFSFGKTKKFW